MYVAKTTAADRWQTVNATDEEEHWEKCVSDISKHQQQWQGKEGAAAADMPVPQTGASQGDPL